MGASAVWAPGWTPSAKRHHAVCWICFFACLLPSHTRAIGARAWLKEAVYDAPSAPRYQHHTYNPAGTLALFLFGHRGVGKTFTSDTVGHSLYQTPTENGRQGYVNFVGGTERSLLFVLHSPPFLARNFCMVLGWDGTSLSGCVGEDPVTGTGDSAQYRRDLWY